MEDKLYCHFCGSPLMRKFVEGRSRLYCDHCVRPIYENPVPATCVVVTHGNGRLLLVQRSIEPKAGQWCLPGGFLELGESPMEGALRELAEETGLNGRIDALLGVRTTTSSQYHSVLMIGYRVTDFTGELAAGDDAARVDWFSYPDLPQIAFNSHLHFIRQIFEPELP
jgi:ADP-ribose pyrophosphatase YjhB (NUDIX family)